MIDTDDVMGSLIERYSGAVNANDSAAYSKLFAPDAIRVPPGSDPEYGPEQIANGEQADYDLAHWSIQMAPVDVLSINDDWVYAIVHVDAYLKLYADETQAEKHATKAFLLQKQSSGEWLIKRYLWNLK